MKKIFRLTESELHHIVRETANKVISRALTENEADGKLCKIIADRILENQVTLWRKWRFTTVSGQYRMQQRKASLPAG